MRLKKRERPKTILVSPKWLLRSWCEWKLASLTYCCTSSSWCSYYGATGPGPTYGKATLQCRIDGWMLHSFRPTLRAVWSLHRLLTPSCWVLPRGAGRQWPPSLGRRWRGGRWDTRAHMTKKAPNPHVTPPFNKALTYCRDFPPLAGERRGNADLHHTKVSNCAERQILSKFLSQNFGHIWFTADKISSLISSHKPFGFVSYT